MDITDEQLDVITVGQSEQQQLEGNNIGAKWSRIEEEQLLKEVGEGLSIDEIAGIHKRKRGGIISRLKVITARMVACGTPLGEACYITGTNYTDSDLAFLVAKYKNEFATKQSQIGASNDNRIGAKWTKIEVDQLLKESSEGLSVYEIAKNHGRKNREITIKLRMITAKMVSDGMPLEEACSKTGTSFTEQDLSVLVAKYSKNKNGNNVVNNETYPPILKQSYHKKTVVDIKPSIRRLNANSPQSTLVVSPPRVSEQPSLKDIFALLSRIERKLDDIEQKI